MNGFGKYIFQQYYEYLPLLQFEVLALDPGHTIPHVGILIGTLFDGQPPLSNQMDEKEEPWNLKFLGQWRQSICHVDQSCLCD